MPKIIDTGLLKLQWGVRFSVWKKLAIVILNHVGQPFFLFDHLFNNGTVTKEVSFEEHGENI